MIDGRGPAIRAADLGWTYAGRPRPSLEGVSFEVSPGSALLVLGASGSGKTTLTRALAGLVPHVLPGTWRGSLRVGDLDIATTPAARLGAEVGIVFQDPASQLVMPLVEDEVAFGLENRSWGRPAMLARVPEALESVGLAGFERRLTAALSGGEQQRIAIADVLAPAPGLIVFDEPTASLDPPGASAVVDRMAALARLGHTVVIVEHRVDLVIDLADVVLLLDRDGRQLAFGTPGEVGRRHGADLARSGAWVPTAWRIRLSAGRDDPRSTPPAGRTPVDPAGSAPHRVPADGGSSGPILHLRDVSVRHPAGSVGMPRPALDGITLAMDFGERIVLVGPNGSGKSTLLATAAGLIRPTTGVVELAPGASARKTPETGPAPGGPAAGTDPARMSSREIAGRLAFVLQDPELGFIGRTVTAEVEAGLDPGTGAESAALLQRLRLDNLADAGPFTLSRGEQRRLSLAAAAIRDVPLLLLDEPTYGLDRSASEETIAILDELRADGQAQVVATHDPRLMARSDRIVALDAGRLVFDGAWDAFIAAPPFSPPDPWRALVPGPDTPPIHPPVEPAVGRP